MHAGAFSRVLPEADAKIAFLTRMTLKKLIVLVALASLAACTPVTDVSLTNQSSVALHDVMVAGSGFSALLPSPLAPGESRVIQVAPKGESGISISFRAGSRHISYAEQGYFEGGGLYSVSVEVQDDLSARIRTQLKYR